MLILGAFFFRKKVHSSSLLPVFENYFVCVFVFRSLTGKIIAVVDFFLVVFSEMLLFLDYINVRGGLTTGDGRDESAMLCANKVQIRFGGFGSILGCLQFTLESADTGQVLLGHALLLIALDFKGVVIILV